MNAYDFDETIYRHDCTVMFYIWCVLHYPKIALRWPRWIASVIRYRRGKINKHAYMECFYEYLLDVPSPEKEAERFWDRQIKNMHSWYKTKQRPDDLVISASPHFLVEPAARRLGIRHLLASPLNPKTGKYEGERCHGEGKVRALRAAYPAVQIDDFYSDSVSDAPMAKIAKRAFLVHGETLTAWPGKGVEERNGQA